MRQVYLVHTTDKQGSIQFDDCHSFCQNEIKGNEWIWGLKLLVSFQQFTETDMKRKSGNWDFPSPRLVAQSVCLNISPVADGQREEFNSSK